MIKILCVGRVKKNYLREMVNDYEKRLLKYTKLQIVEIEGFDNIEKESFQFLKIIKPKDFVIVLDVEGNELSSLELSHYIEKKQINHSNLVFIIGSSNGVHNSVKERSDYQISFSKLTFPNQLFRAILLEQLYRSFK